MLNAICITTNQLEHIQTNLCIHLSYLEDQRNLKIYNKNIKKKKKRFVTPPSEWLKLFPPPLFIGIKLPMPPSLFIAPLPVISPLVFRGKKLSLVFARALPIAGVAGRGQIVRQAINVRCLLQKIAARWGHSRLSRDICRH